jgi:hypothetical protein
MIGGYHPWFHEELARRCHAEQSERAGELGLAAGIPDYPTYRERVGLIAGLQRALEIADEIKRDLDR